MYIDLRIYICRSVKCDNVIHNTYSYSDPKVEYKIAGCLDFC